MIEHFRYLKSVASAGIGAENDNPGAERVSGASRQDHPRWIGLRIVRGILCRSGEIYRQVVRGFGEAGCRYLQLDEVYMIVLVDPKQRQFFVEHGNDAEKLPELYSQRDQHRA